jgi:DNA mismatch endonuclease (patch repair protein)
VIQLPPAPAASSGAVRRTMRGNTFRDTRPELALRSALHQAGLRYRVGIRPVPSIKARADVVFTRPRIAMFLDGCFWHGCPDHFTPPTCHEPYWTAKIARNRERDAAVTLALQTAGWSVVRVWEHESPGQVALAMALRLTGPNTVTSDARSSERGVPAFLVGPESPQEPTRLASIPL